MALITGSIIDRAIDATGCWSPAAKPSAAAGSSLSRFRVFTTAAANNAWRASMATRRPATW